MKFQQFFFAVLMGLMLFPMVGMAQEMEMTTENPEAAKELRMALNLMGHDMPKFGQHIQNAYKLDPNMPMAMMFMTANAPSEEAAKPMIDKIKAYKGELNDGEKVFAEMVAYVGDTTYEASETASKLTELYPNDAGLHVMNGYILMGEEKAEKAIVHFNKAIELDQHPGAMNMKGYALMSLGKMDKAKDAFEAYLQAVPDHANPHDSMGDLLMAMEDYEGAAESFEKAASMSSDDSISAEKAKKAREMMKK